MCFASMAHAVDVIDPAEVTPGSSGICVTEMDGGERVEIPLTVIGTVGPWTPEGEIVLVRLEDERFRHTGIIAGMSGSPVYIDGRLLGALAFGWSFSKEPIGGVTPFSRMESLGDDRHLSIGCGSRPPDAHGDDGGRTRAPTRRGAHELAAPRDIGRTAHPAGGGDLIDRVESCRRRMALGELASFGLGLGSRWQLRGVEPGEHRAGRHGGRCHGRRRRGPGGGRNGHRGSRR